MKMRFNRNFHGFKMDMRTKKNNFLFCPGLFIVFFILITPRCVLADIYRYIDSNGVMHFTNVPTSDNYKVYIKEKPARSKKKRDTDKFDGFIDQASRHHDLPFSLLKAMIRAESSFNPKAVSKKGALGLMQIMPENLESFKVKDPFNPKENIMGGAGYMKLLLKEFDGKVALALAAYNAGPGTVRQHNGIPPIRETEDYVKRVMKYYYLYKKS